MTVSPQIGRAAIRPKSQSSASAKPTTPTPRLKVARAAMEKAVPARKVVPELAPVDEAEDDGNGVVRIRDEDAHDLSAWDY